MKKLLIITLVVGLIGAVGFAAYAHSEGQNARRSGGMRGGRSGGMHAGMHGWGLKENEAHEDCLCGGDGPEGIGRAWGKGWNRSETAVEVISEEKAKEAAETFAAKYFPEYTVESVEKDSRRPIYVATLKGADGAELQMFIRGFDGKVTHLFPKIAEEPAE